MKEYQLPLFPEPEPPLLNGSAVLDFELALKDGSKVLVHYERRAFKFSAHLEFYGDSVSSTGYRSFFSGEYLMNDPDDAVVKAACEIAEHLREQRLGEIAKENRRKKRKKGV
jgi:hypothetical protein